MAVIYRYARYHVPGEEQMDSLEGALVRAWYDVEYNEACPKQIVAEDGTVLMEYEAILEAITKLNVGARE